DTCRARETSRAAKPGSSPTNIWHQKNAASNVVHSDAMPAVIELPVCHVGFILAIDDPVMIDTMNTQEALRAPHTTMPRRSPVRIRSGWLLAMLGGGLCLLLTPLIINRVHSAEIGDDLSREPVQGREEAAVASAPEVPPPITRKHATRVILNVEVREHVKTLADGVQYLYWTFGDETPGKFIRVREGDLVETHFSNHPDNQLAHNLDFHGCTGPGGGGEVSFIAPGHECTFTWRAMRPGLYLYHCVAAPAGVHISNGMYGLILVEPKGGMPKVDREFYICQGEFY